MQERQKIITEYFDLTVKLNRSNKLPNMPTVLDFEIIQDTNRNFQFRAKLNNSNASILLAGRTRTNLWRPSGFSGFEFLEKFVVEQLNSINSQLLNDKVISHIKESLSSLGISKHQF